MLELFVASCLFSFFGVLSEIIFTGIYDYFISDKKNWKGEVSLLMFPVYWIAYFLFSTPIHFLFASFLIPFQVQCLLVVILIYIIEYCAGRLYLHFGMSCWHYDHVFTLFGKQLRFDVDNVITFLYFPLWYLFAFIGLLFDQVIITKAMFLINFFI